MPHSSNATTPVSEKSPLTEQEQTKTAPGQSDNMNLTDDSSVEKLSLTITKLSLDTPLDSANDDSVKQNGSGDSFTEGQTSASIANGEQLTDSEVIVGNQNADDSQINKELQAILQWMVASHLNVPNLTFINENDNELSKLPMLAEKAGQKAYTVGDILQEVKRYFVQQQMNNAVGNVPSIGLLDWLLANL